MKLFKNFYKEIKESEYLFDKIQYSFLKSYAENNLKWFIRKAIFNKYAYYTFTIITIVCPIISGIVFFIPLDDIYLKLISEIILGISSISAALLPLFDFRKNWYNYRNQAEQIKEILAKFMIYPYDVNIVDEIEKTKLQTHEKWMQSFYNNIKSEEKNN